MSLSADDIDDDRKLCPRCSKDRLCCEMLQQDCDSCGDGYVGHDCGEDTCCCLHPEDNVPCDVCDGRGWWWYCNCDENGEHAGTSGQGGG